MRAGWGRRSPRGRWPGSPTHARRRLASDAGMVDSSRKRLCYVDDERSCAARRDRSPVSHRSAADTLREERRRRRQMGSITSFWIVIIVLALIAAAVNFVIGASHRGEPIVFGVRLAAGVVSLAAAA